MLKVDELIALHDQARIVFEDLWDRARENARYKEAEHWSEDDSAKIEAQGRQAYSIPFTAEKINKIVASQKRNRVGYKIESSIDPNDEIKAAIANVQMLDLEKRCQLKYLDSDVFDSGASVLFGGWEVYKDSTKYGDIIPSVKEIDYLNFVFDPNSTKYDKSDALFMSKLEKVYRYQIRDEYGKKAAEISEDSGLWGRDTQSYFGGISDNRDFDILTIFKHYQRVVRDYHYMLFNDYLGMFGQPGVISEKFSNKKEAGKKLRAYKVEYLDRGYPLGKAVIEKHSTTAFDYYEFTRERILKHEETDLEDFPFILYFSYHHKEKFWTMADLLKSAQRFFDRYLAQIDYSFGKDIKNAYEIVVNKLAEGFTYEQALQRLEEDGILPVKVEGAIKNVRSQGANPQWVQMIGLMQSFIEDLAGGRSFQGLSEGASESGRAINLKKQQGELTASLLMDNFVRAKDNLGRVLLKWFNKHDTAGRLVKVAGGELTPEMTQMLTNEGLFTKSVITPESGFVRTTHLDDAELELTVTQTELSDTQKEKKLQEIMVAGQVNPNLTQLPTYTEKMLEYTGMNFSDRKRLIEEYRQMLLQQSQANEDQKNVETNQKQQEINTNKAKVLIDGYNKTKKREKNETS